MKKHFKFYLIVLLALIIALFSACDDGGGSSDSALSIGKLVGGWETSFIEGPIKSSDYGYGNYERTISCDIIVLHELNGIYYYSLHTETDMLLYSDSAGSNPITDDDYADYYREAHSSVANVDKGTFTFSAKGITTTSSNTSAVTEYTASYAEENSGIRLTLTSGGDSKTYYHFCPYDEWTGKTDFLESYANLNVIFSSLNFDAVESFAETGSGSGEIWNLYGDNVSPELYFSMKGIMLVSDRLDRDGYSSDDHYENPNINYYSTTRNDGSKTCAQLTYQSNSVYISVDNDD